MSKTDGLLGEVDWKHFARYWWRGVGRLPILILFSVSLYLGLYNLSQHSPAEESELYELMALFTIGGSDVDLLSILMMLVLLWVVFPFIQSVVALKPLLGVLKR